MNVKVIGATAIILVAIVGIPFILENFDTSENVIIIETSDNTTVKIASEEFYDNFELTEKNSKNKVVRLENSWINLNSLQTMEEVKKTSKEYSSVFDREDLGCLEYKNENQQLTATICSHSYYEKDEYNMLSIISGYHYDDSIPKVFNVKENVKRTDFPSDIVTLYRHCQWHTEIIGDINELSC